MDIVIRNAEEADLTEVAEVCRCAYMPLREIYQPTREARDFKRQIAHSLSRLVAVCNGRIAGTVEFIFEDVALHFLGLAVHPDCQRQGIGRALIEDLVSIACGHGLKKITLDTVKETGNVTLFEKLGFHTVKEDEATQFESDRYHRLTNVVMEKAL